ncbi:hypothetical protein Poli38472_007393 [Pythium oligandrum]|uniref:Phosphatidylinositol-specific phospholipase C X domain-containing protein n=1 Tax=Pythium oligandrum TaxID=41045 RepID=A0A8K1FHZ7_PYTOL|nr:hypothetical protein Poli38472_007393 [Pythium oligandrum]|eukprot:TMW59248.1 hypothetical protein Poli38472_007393 [Pythium oligandrum]
MFRTILAVAVALPAVLAGNGAYRSLSKASNADWMKNVPDDRLISDMSIPGTHESMAITGGDFTECQENFGESGQTLAAQFKAGIRMIDIRARINDGNTFTIHHGAVYQKANFDDVLNKIGDFLRDHPSETVLMRLKQECTGDVGSCKDASGQSSFQDIFDKYRRDFFWGPSVQRGSRANPPALKDVRGKLVLVVMNGKLGNPLNSYGLSSASDWDDASSTYVQDEYNVPNLGAIATKRDQVRRFLDKSNAGDKTKLWVNFASGASVFAQPQAVAGGALFIQGVNPFLLDYLNQGHGITRTSVIMMDFPGNDLISKIISKN